MTKKFWTILSLVLFGAFVPSLSHAACLLHGTIVRVTAYDNSYSATGGFIYFRTSNLVPYYYFVTTNDDHMISNAINHMNSGRPVYISGNIAQCPAVPAAGGAASLGTLQYMYNNY